jgi:hypothetical protein
MRAIVCGGRDYDDRDSVFSILDRARVKLGLEFVIEGGALGADRLAREWAQARGVPFQTYEADWKGEGRSAGPKRNARMLHEGKPGCVIAFAGGNGTNNMVRQAETAGVKVYRIP